MTLGRWLSLLIFVLPVSVTAQSAISPSESSPDQARPAPNAALSDAAELLDEVELSMTMARDGQYGPIRGREMERLETAYAYIVETLSHVKELSELSPQKQQSLTLAQSQFDGILKPEDSHRKICKRVASTGTRLGALECLTLAERRARAEASREMVQQAQRGFCIPGEGNACGG